MSKPNPLDPEERVSLSMLLKRGTLYGAALGLLAGLIYQAFARLPEVQAIVAWRNFVLGGAAIGFVLGLIVGFLRRDAEANGGEERES